MLSAGLRKGVDDLQTDLARLSQVLDAVLFRDMWKGLAAALNRLVFNGLITEARFSPQVQPTDLCWVITLHYYCPNEADAAVNTRLVNAGSVHHR